MFINQGVLLSFATLSVAVSATCVNELWDVIIVGMSS